MFRVTKNYMGANVGVNRYYFIPDRFDYCNNVYSNENDSDNALENGVCRH